MSKELELWRALQNESNIAEALERDREAEMRARKAEKLSRFVEAEMQTSSSTPLDGYALELSKIEAEIQEATKRQHASLGTMFRSDPSVPPGYVLPRDREAEMRAALPRVEGYEECDDDSLILTCETDPDCGVAHRVVMPGMFVRRILGTRRADITVRASQLADKCGALKTENTALLVENARLRRRVEDMERKGKR